MQALHLAVWLKIWIVKVLELAGYGHFIAIGLYSFFSFSSHLPWRGSTSLQGSYAGVEARAFGLPVILIFFFISMLNRVGLTAISRSVIVWTPVIVDSCECGCLTRGNNHLLS
jgi:hypothetical protein